MMNRHNESHVTVKNALLLIGILFIVACSVAVHLPSPHVFRWVQPVNKYFMSPLGLSQAWAMFQFKLTYTISMQLRRTYEDGHVEIDQLRGPRVGYGRTVHNQMFENIPFDKSEYANPYLRYQCKKYKQLDPTLKKVELLRAFHKTPSISEAANEDPFKDPVEYTPSHSYEC